MLRKLYPRAYFEALSHIEPDYFLQRGLKGVILDLDNTLLPWRAGAMEQEVQDIINRYKDAGLAVCIVSNALNKRLTSLLEPLAIPWIGRAGKPRRKPFLRALHIMGTKPSETAVVGDQLFTDIYGGNRLKLYTVLVRPVSRREFVTTRMVRVFEKVLLRRMVKKGVIPSRVPVSDEVEDFI